VHGICQFNSRRSCHFSNFVLHFHVLCMCRWHSFSLVAEFSQVSTRINNVGIMQYTRHRTSIPPFHLPRRRGDEMASAKDYNHEHVLNVQTSMDPVGDWVRVRIHKNPCSSELIQHLMDFALLSMWPEASVLARVRVSLGLRWACGRRPHDCCKPSGNPNHSQDRSFWLHRLGVAENWTVNAALLPCAVLMRE
jgi:hypothetical protein